MQAGAPSLWGAAAPPRETAAVSRSKLRFMRAPSTPAEPADAELVARYARGDPHAARALATRHAPRLMAVATRVLGDPAEAEDVTQEALLRLWRVAPEWEPRGAAVGTWLYRVASNLCIDRLRRPRALGSDAVPEVPDDRPDADGHLQAADRAAALQAALATLPDRQRIAIVLRHFEERGNPEIAEILETSVEAVESLLARARRSLTESLAPRRLELGYTDD